MQTFTQGLLAYATGRTLEYKDMPTVRRIVRGAAASDYRLSAIVQGGGEERAVQNAAGAQAGAGGREGRGGSESLAKSGPLGADGAGSPEA